MDDILFLSRALIVNILITIFSSIIPLFIGILLSLLAKKSSIASKIFGWLKIPFESICIPIFILVLFYLPSFIFETRIFSSNNFSSSLIMTIALSTAYLLYIPARYNPNFSFLKNTLFNSLGLISALFKWSFVAGFIAINDMLFAARALMATKYNIWPLLITFLTISIILFIIELAKTLIKQFMK